MGEFVEAAKALSAPATKLIEVVSRGIGRAYDPRYKRKMADATAYELDTVAGAVRRNCDLPILLDRDGIQMDGRSVQELAERTQMRLFSQEMRKQQNIESIVDEAFEQLKDESEVSSEGVDDDWIVRFFNSVEDVSVENIQVIWGKVLAGEITHPHSVSLRTLETLKNLSQQEAQLFQRYSDFVLHTRDVYFLPSECELDAEYRITDKEINLLDDAGLISNKGRALNLIMDDRPRQVNNDQIVGLFDVLSDPNGRPTLTSYYLTNAGVEIYKTVKMASSTSEEFAIKYFTLLKQKQSHLRINAHRVIKIENNHIFFEGADLI